MKSAAYHRSYACQAEPRNSYQPSLPAFSQAFRSQPMSHGATPAADECLSGPKGRNATRQPLVLSHRSRHQTSLLVSRGAKSLRKALAGNSAPSAQPASPAAEATMQPSIADAHAELPPADGYRRRPNAVTRLAPANSRRQRNDLQTPSIWRRNRSAVASRWPNSRAPAPRPCRGRPQHGGSRPAIQTRSSTDSRPRSAAPFAVFIHAEIGRNSIPTLLLAMIGALALAGRPAALVFRRRRRGCDRPRAQSARRSRSGKRPIDDRIVLSD